MRCPNCDLENDKTSTYCQRCGTQLQSFPEYEIPEQSEYQVPPPPPLNGHNSPPPPTPPVYDYANIPSTFTADETPLPNEYGDPLPYAAASAAASEGRSTLFYAAQRVQQPRRIGIFSGILYFLGILLIAIGIVNILTTFSTSAIVMLTGRLLSLAILIASIALFVYLVRNHTTLLHWWTRILWIIGLAVGAFILLVIIELFNPSKFVNMLATGCMFFLYGLVWCAIAVW